MVDIGNIDGKFIGALVGMTHKVKSLEDSMA
jgi:hypothetical protein